MSIDTVVLGRGPTGPLADGTVKPAGIALHRVEVSPIIAAYRRMVRELAYGVCEMAPTTYLLARSVGKRFTALPVFVNRKFHHGDLVVREGAGIRVPRDLEGRRVGVRAYTVTTGVWVRGILQNEYGVDLDSITWVTDDEEHVEEFQNPANVEAAPPGTSLAAMLASGRIDAALTGNAGIGRAGAPRPGWAAEPAPTAASGVTGLFPAPQLLEADWYLRTGIYPIHGLIVVRDDLLASDPGLAAVLFEAFRDSRDRYLTGLDTGGPTAPEDEAVLRHRLIVGENPLPYGVEQNRKSLDALVTYAAQQRIIPEPIPIDDLFAPEGEA